MIRVILSIVALLFAGCSSSALNTPELVRSHASYEALKKDPKVNQYAASSLFQAGKLYNLSKSVKSEEEAKHFAYLLEQEVVVAKESAKAKIIEEKLALLREKKVKALLAAKESELQDAREEARAAKEQVLGLEKKYQELQELNAKMTSRGLVLTVGDVLFETGKASLMSGVMRALDKLVEFLGEHESRKVLIEGHTDNVGSTTYNIDLSLRRADAVATALLSRGVDAARIETKGYGEAYPIASNANAAGRQQNRRVEIVILRVGERVEDIER